MESIPDSDLTLVQPREYGGKQHYIYVAFVNIQHLLPKFDEINLILNHKISARTLDCVKRFWTNLFLTNVLILRTIFLARKLGKSGGISVYLNDYLNYERL